MIKAHEFTLIDFHVGGMLSNIEKFAPKKIKIALHYIHLKHVTYIQLYEEKKKL